MPKGFSSNLVSLRFCGVVAEASLNPVGVAEGVQKQARRSGERSNLVSQGRETLHLCAAPSCHDGCQGFKEVVLAVEMVKKESIYGYHVGDMGDLVFCMSVFSPGVFQTGWLAAWRQDRLPQSYTHPAPVHQLDAPSVGERQPSALMRVGGIVLLLTTAVGFDEG
jgi:hypothetical protein